MDTKAYRVYIRARRRIIVSRDVQLDEGKVLRRYLDLPTEQQPARESGVKFEEPDV